MMDQFWVDKLMPALRQDSLVSSHPVSVTVSDPKDIESIFDTISYKKGSSIIHMLEDYLGEEVLRTGLKKYLKKHKFGTAVTKDLWKSLAEATENKIDVEAMMNTWTLQTGYPLITLTRGDVVGNEKQGWCIKQSRFLSSSQELTNKSTHNDSSSSWFVPVQLMSDISPKQMVMLNAASNNSNGHVELPTKLKWVKANVGGSGYYRVQYPPEVYRCCTVFLLIILVSLKFSAFSDLGGTDKSVDTGTQCVQRCG